ncbi:MAG: SDR family oxidoreductase [Terrimicrobiaceae bacterium]|nr:SDR family oxidoreductase [Terrimicrobiaceae bacterium]
MDLQLTNKSALISASTSGIGYSIARTLAREGCRVFVNGRDQGKTEAAADRIRSEVPGADATPIAADLSTAEGAAQLFPQLPDVDILVNNLGIYEPVEFTDADDALWRRFFEVNVLSGVRLTRHYLPGMIRRNWGRVVFIASESAIQIPKEMIHYGMTKTAQIAISRGLAESVAGTGVTINSVLPGPTRTDGVEEFVAKVSGGNDFAAFEKTFFESVRPTSLTRRFAHPDEVAALTAFVASPLASSTTGAALRTEGGIVKSLV